MGLLGTENEEVAQALMKVQSVLAILNGVQAIANVLNKDSALMLRIQQIRQLAKTATTTSDTIATTLNTTATSANSASIVVNTTAQKAWNIAKAAPVAFCPVCFQRATSLFLLMSNIRRLITNVRDKEADTIAI